MFRVLSILTAILLSFGTILSAGNYDGMSGEEAFEAAISAFDSKEYVEAYGLISYAAEIGSRDANILLGLTQSHGLVSSEEYAPRMEDIRQLAISNNIERNDKRALSIFLAEAEFNDFVWRFIGELYGTSDQVGIDYEKAIAALSETSGNRDRINEFNTALQSGLKPLKVGNVKVGARKSKQRNCDDFGKCTIDGKTFYVEYAKNGYDTIISKILVASNLPLDADRSNLDAILAKLSSKYELDSEPTKTELANQKAGTREAVDWFYRDYTIQVSLQRNEISIVFMDEEQAKLAKASQEKDREMLERILDLL